MRRNALCATPNTFLNHESQPQRGASRGAHEPLMRSYVQSACLQYPAVSCFLSPETKGYRRHCWANFESRLPTSLSALRANARQRRTADLKLQNVSCLLSPVSCLLSPVSCLLSPVSCLLSLVSCLLSPVSCLLSPVFCLLSPVSCLLSPVSCLLPPATCPAVFSDPSN